MSAISYYSVMWIYDGPSCGAGGPHDEPEHPSNQAFDEASHEARAILELAGLVYKHQYGWPDGSLYHYIRAFDHNGNVNEKIQVAMGRIKLNRIRHFKLTLVSKNTDPGKVGCKTMEEYFDKD